MRRQFVESMKRLYESNRVTKEKVIALFNSGKITNAEKEYILSAH